MESAPGTHWIGGWVGPRASLDVGVRRKIPSPYRDSNPQSLQIINSYLSIFEHDNCSDSALWPTVN